MGAYSIVDKDEALAAATAETLIQVVAPATKRLRILRWGVSLDGVTASAVPGDVDFLRQTSAGTASASTVVKLDEADPAALATGQVAFTVEPTAGDVLESHQVTPNGGLLVIEYSLDAAPVVAASGRVAIRATFAATVNISSFVVWAE